MAYASEKMPPAAAPIVRVTAISMRTVDAAFINEPSVFQNSFAHLRRRCFYIHTLFSPKAAKASRLPLVTSTSFHLPKSSLPDDGSCDHPREEAACNRHSPTAKFVIPLGEPSMSSNGTRTVGNTSLCSWSNFRDQARRSWRKRRFLHARPGEPPYPNGSK